MFTFVYMNPHFKKTLTILKCSVLIQEEQETTKKGLNKNIRCLPSLEKQNSVRAVTRSSCSHYIEAWLLSLTSLLP